MAAQSPELGVAIVVAHRGQDVERDRPDLRLAHLVEVVDAESEVVDDDRDFLRPRPSTQRLENDWGEHLDPVLHELAVPRVALLTVLPAGEPVGALASARGRVAVGRSAADLDERFGHIARREGALARPLWPLMRATSRSQLTQTPPTVTCRGSAGTNRWKCSPLRLCPHG